MNFRWTYRDCDALQARRARMAKIVKAAGWLVSFVCVAAIYLVACAGKVTP